MNDYVLLGMMKAEFEEACAAIDARAKQAQTELMRDVVQALLAGDTTKRDRLRARSEDVAVAREQARLEAWLRIGEKRGLSRESALKALRKIAN